MAIPVKIHPIDLEVDVAVGVDLPLIGSTGTFFQLNYTTLDQAVANAKNLLLTNQGERVMQPNFGCNLHKALFEPITFDLKAKIDDLIRTQFSLWLPYIFINELVVNPVYDQNRIGISMIVSLQGNKFSTRSIQLTVTATPDTV